MTNETEQKALEKPESGEEANGETSTDQAEQGPSRIKPLIFPFIVLLIAIAGMVYLYQRVQQLEQNTVRLTTSSETDLASLNNKTLSVSGKLADVQALLEELQARQEALELSTPQETQVHINKDYALAEVEHLLIIASYNLQLDHDVATALAAMEAADLRLNGLNDPRVLDVRQQIISDMNALRSLNQADLSGLGLYLSDLISRVDELPLKENLLLEAPELENEEVEQQANSFSQFFSLVWQELKSLVIISRDKDVARARLLPDEVYFLRANIKLELANARFAVFNRDTDNLHASVEHIQHWITEHFDMTDAAVKNIYDSLVRMKSMELAFPEMDISSSLESVRALVRDQSPQADTIEQVAP